jgi:hypothetical protein
MPTTRRFVAVLLAIALLSGCVPDAAPDTTAPAPSTTTTSSTLPQTTTTSATIDPNAALEEQCGDADAPFTSSGAVGTGGSAESDASVVQAYTWQHVGACERVRVGFATAEGAPAVTPPQVDVRFLRWAGVVRLDFGTSVAAAVVAEQIVDTELIDRIYTVTEVDGTMYVDLHLRVPAFVRAFTTSGPAAILVDLAHGGQNYELPATRNDGLVVIAPDPAATTYPLTVTGYTMEADDTIEGILRGPDGSTVIGEAVVGSHDFTWGGFSMVFPNGPPGLVSITIDEGPGMELTIP